MAGLNPAGWVETGSENNSLATATRAAEATKSHIVFSMDASFSATVSGALVQIKDDTSVIWEGYVYDSREVSFPRGLKITEGNACSAELSASGTGGTVGKINLHGVSL